MPRLIIVLLTFLALQPAAAVAQVIDRSPRQAPAGAGGSRMGDEPLIIAADALEQQGEEGRHCVLAVTANAISGQFAGLVLRWMNEPDAALAVRMHMSAGQIDWRNGIETFDEPLEAWVETGDLSLRGRMRQVETRRQATYAGQVDDAMVAADLYEAVFSAPLRLFYVSESSGATISFLLDDFIDAEVQVRSRQCMAKLAGGEGPEQAVTPAAGAESG
ncbi:MAG: hypothetical protein HKO62_14095 [Gammaproteobacteria bacterium]|nr:hypothetical protein [Gammaproteobacteria bacterium]